MKVKIKGIPKARAGKSISTMWGGSTNQISFNPYDGGTLEFSGQTHDESSDGLSGIGISYAGNPVEVEDKETATVSPDGSLNVMGNLYVPGTRTKFKAASKEIAKQEEKYNKLKEKGSNLVNSSDVADNFDKLKFNAGKIMMLGGDMGQKDLSEKKQSLSALQKAILETADEQGVCADCLSKGIIKKARNGYTVTPKAQTGIHIKDDEFNKKFKEAIALRGERSGGKYDVKSQAGSTAYGKYQFTRPTRKSIWEKHYKKEYPKFEDFDKDFQEFGTLQEDVMTNHINDLRREYGDDVQAISLVHRLGPVGYKRTLKDPTLLNKPVYASVPQSGDKETPQQYLDRVMKGSTPKTLPMSPARPRINIPSKIGIPDAPPFTYKAPTPVEKKVTNPPAYDIGKLTDTERDIPSNVEPLNFLQIAPELYSLATNQQSPVQAQKFQPQLYIPYTSRFDDQLIDNTLTFRALSQLYPSNPEALSFLAAQKYSADNKVKGEEFRYNQAIQQDVTNKNIALLNDAQLKNLGIMDTQYTRQETAKAKTQAQNQLIINSISNKYLQNRLENKRLAAYENLYDYRFVDTDEDSIPDEAQYFGDIPIFSAGTNPIQTQGTSRYTRQRVEQKTGGKKVTTTYPSQAQNEKTELDIKEKSEKRFNLNKLFHNR